MLLFVALLAATEPLLMVPLLLPLVLADLLQPALRSASLLLVPVEPLLLFARLHQLLNVTKSCRWSTSVVSPDTAVVIRVITGC